jgi:hypothetical protein
MKTSTTASSRSLLDKETDARFWAQTHYRVGRKLDPKDPTDKAMMRVWLDIFAKVKREDSAGVLVLTYNDPAVERHLDDARLAMQAAGAHLDAAVRATDPAQAQRHADAAAIATTTASSATHAAAALQPPTVSPLVVTAAAHEAAVAAALPPPVHVVASLPAEHPAVSSSAAQPVLPPGVATSPPAQPIPPTQPDQHLAIAQAVSAPAVAVAVHEAAHDRAAQGQPLASGTLSPSTIAQIRGTAAAVAQRTPGSFVGVSCSSQEQWSTLVFPSSDAAADWYGATADTPEEFRYLAYYDKTDATSWPQPVNELFGSGKALVVTAQPPPRAARTNLGAIAAIAALAFGGAVALASGSRKEPR